MADTTKLIEQKNLFEKELQSKQSEQASLLKEREETQKKLKKHLEHTKESEGMFTKVDEIAKISDYFSNENQSKDNAPLYKRINRVALQKKQQLQTDLNNWHTLSMDQQAQLAQELDEYDNLLLNLEQQISALDSKLAPINEKVAKIKEKKQKLKELQEKQLEEKLSSIKFGTKPEKKKILVWSVWEGDTDGDDFVASVEVHFGFLKVDFGSDGTNELVWWILDDIIVAPSNSGAISISAEVTSSMSINGIWPEIHVRVMAKVSTGKITYSSNNENSSSTQKTISSEIGASLGVEGIGAIESKISAAKTSLKTEKKTWGTSTATDGASVTKILEYTFKNKDGNLSSSCDYIDSKGLEIKALSRAAGKEHLERHYDDKEHDYIVLEEKVDDSKM